MSTIVVQNISKIFSEKRLFQKEKKHLVINDLSFQIKKAERVGLIGPNGSGKSTTIKMLSGIVKPTSGSILIEGKTPWNNRKEIASKLGIVTGNCSQLWQNRSVEDNFIYFKIIYGINSSEYKKRLELLIENFKIEKLLKKNICNLSLGERMKCELAVGFLHNPNILFLDEPSIGLDINTKIAFRQLLKKTSQQKNTTMILTSHDMDDIENICDRLIIINKGSMVYDGSIQGLKEKYEKNKTIKIYTENFPKNWTFPGCKVIRTVENPIEVCVDIKKANMADVITHIARKSAFTNIEIESLSLESIIGNIYDE
jgi:ABC-2 type transport system ATP-binding protein